MRIIITKYNNNIMGIPRVVLRLSFTFEVGSMKKKTILSNIRVGISERFFLYYTLITYYYYYYYSHIIHNSIQ